MQKDSWEQMQDFHTYSPGGYMRFIVVEIALTCMPRSPLILPNWIWQTTRQQALVQTEAL